MKKVGIDIVQNNRISLRTTFVNKILTQQEIQLFRKIGVKKAKIAFLAGRWACKEAIWKTLDKKHRITFNKINIGYEDETPIITNDNLKHILISISHEQKYSVGLAVNIND